MFRTEILLITLCFREKSLERTSTEGLDQAASLGAASSFLLSLAQCPGADPYRLHQGGPLPSGFCLVLTNRNPGSRWKEGREDGRAVASWLSSCGAPLGLLCSSSVAHASSQEAFLTPSLPLGSLLSSDLMMGTAPQSLTPRVALAPSGALHRVLITSNRTGPLCHTFVMLHLKLPGAFEMEGFNVISTSIFLLTVLVNMPLGILSDPF